MEYAEHGALRQHLREMRSPTPGPVSQLILNFATQIALGMAYLEGLKVRNQDITLKKTILKLFKGPSPNILYSDKMNVLFRNIYLNCKGLIFFTNWTDSK